MPVGVSRRSGEKGHDAQKRSGFGPAFQDEAVFVFRVIRPDLSQPPVLRAFIHGIRFGILSPLVRFVVRYSRIDGRRFRETVTSGVKTELFFQPALNLLSPRYILSGALSAGEVFGQRQDIEGCRFGKVPFHTEEPAGLSITCTFLT